MSITVIRKKFSYAATLFPTGHKSYVYYCPIFGRYCAPKIGTILYLGRFYVQIFGHSYDFQS